MANLPQVTDNKKLDARIVKTLDSIEQAFFDLLKQKDYGDITVQDILTTALINRTTFYKYYENKEDLAGHMIELIKRDFFEPLLTKRFGSSWEEFVKALPSIATDEHHHKICLLWKISAPRINLKNDVYELIKDKYISTAEPVANMNTNDLLFQGHMYASFCIAMTEYSINHQQLDDHDQKYRNLQQVFERILR